MALRTELPAFAAHMGFKVIEITQERVRIDMPVAPQLINMNDTLHGGAFLALADQCGGMMARQLMGDNQFTTTVESKTNFLSLIGANDTAHGEATVLHHGRTTAVVQIRITRDDGKLASITTQTQFFIDKK